jgi:hypothetical protein
VTLVLSGMRDRRKYLLDSDSGVWTKTSEILGDGGVPGFSGFADVRRVGLLARRAVFVAVYALGGRVWARIGEDTFDLDAPAIRVSRVPAAPLVKTFEIWERDVLLLRHQYWWADLHDWPDDDVFDIFLYIPSNLGTTENRRRIAALWTLMQKGMPATDAARAVERADRLQSAPEGKS